MAPPRKKTKVYESHQNHYDEDATPNPSTVDTRSEVTKPKASTGHKVASSQANSQMEDSRFTVEGGRKPIQCIRKGLKSIPPSLIFTHGAGGDCTAAAMVSFMTGYAKTSTVICFDGSMNLKSRAEGFTDVGKEYPDVSAYGGRSLGARAAVIAADSSRTNALVLISYPLVSPGGDVRDQILLDITPNVDVLFISGDHDSMCDIERLCQVRANMKAKSWLVVVQDGDHGMNVKPKSATTMVGETTGQIAAEWLHEAPRDHSKAYRMVFKCSKEEAIVGSWASSLAKATAIEGKLGSVTHEVTKQEPAGKASTTTQLRAPRRSKRKKSPASNK